MFRSGVGMVRASSAAPAAKSPPPAKVALRDKIKGTFLEKWAQYWKSLYADYKSMLVDIKTDAQEKPTKAIAVCSAIAVAVQMARHNPNEIDFRNDLRNYNNRLLLVAESCRNPNTVKHFKDLEKYSNQNILRKTNLGIASVMWVDDYSEDCDLYKTKCDYTKPTYLSIPSRIVDVGVFGKWWNAYIQFQDFDVNE